MILKLSVNNQSVESSGITKDYKDALCEYVWNSFEANATAVAIDCIPNELTGSAEIVITDNGDGIAYDSLERTFGAFLASQKNSRSLQIKTKANKGKGRFSCFSFASLAEWSTVTATPDGNIAYTISLENADKNQCDVSDPAPTTRSTGTRLIISGIDGICEDDVSFAQLEDTMLKAFAWYLYLNKDKKIVLTINGTELDYRKYINTDASVEKEILISRIPFKIALIVWNEKITENFSVYFLDEEGVVRSKDTTTFNRNTVNFNHSVFVTSPFFLGRDGITLKGKRVELDGQTALNEYDEDKKVLKELSKEIQELICKGWFLPPNTYDCGSFVVNGTAVVGKESKHLITAGNQHTKELIFMKSLFDQMGGTYHQEGDYLIPNLTLPDEPEYQIGKYGRMRRSYLKAHRPVLYANFLTSGTLHRHLAEIDQACNEHMEIIVSAMAKQESATEALKAADQLEWVRRMNSIRSRAEEIVLTELVYN